MCNLYYLNILLGTDIPIDIYLYRGTSYNTIHKC